MFIFNKYRLQDEETGGDGGNGGEGGDKDNKDNKDNHLISHDSLWDAPANEDKSGDNKDNNQQQQQQQQQSNPNEVFDKHIEGLDFTGGIDLAASIKAIQDGDVEVFGKLLQQVGANAYRNSLVDANKVVQQRVDKMALDVKADVSSSTATSDLVKEMHTALPFTKNPAFAPVAQLTLTQFLTKGVSPKEAIKEVGKYFENLSGEVSKMNPNPPNGRPTGQFRGNAGHGSDGNASEDEPDWITLLGGPAV